MSNQSKDNEKGDESWGQEWESLYPVRRSPEEYSMHVKREFEISRHGEEIEESLYDYLYRAKQVQNALVWHIAFLEDRDQQLCQEPVDLKKKAYFY